MSLTLDSKMALHPGIKEIKRLKKQANEFRDMAHKYKRNFGQAEREQRKALFDEARNIMKEVERTEQYILDDLLARAQVITATLVGANHYTVRNLSFHTVVIDEAGQALEPASWIPILKGRKLVLAGDHCQLPPTVKSEEAARNGLNITLLEKCVTLHPEAVVLLEEQYRMHEQIMGYSSAVFYQGQLKAHTSVAGHKLFSADRPLVFVDTAGCGFDERTEGFSTSNPEEAAFLFKHLTQFAGELNTHYKAGDLPRIAVISPYRRQIDLLKEQLMHSPLLQVYGDKLTVNTIDSFQGQERDIVYIGMTRSNADQPSAVTLIAANAARCRLIALKISPRTIGHRRASSMTNGVASAQGSQETNTIKNGRSQALPTPTACMVRRVWLASNNAPAHQMAAIQVQPRLGIPLLTARSPVERASARASVMTDTLHHGRGEDPGLQRMAVLLQRAVSSRSSCRQYNRLRDFSEVRPGRVAR